MYSSGFRSHAVVLIRRYGLLVSIRYDPLQNPAGLAPPSPPTPNSSWFKREVCDPNPSDVAPCTQELLPHCSEWARQIVLQSLFEHACFFRREHKAIWHGLVIFFWNIGYVYTPFKFFSPLFLFPHELFQERASEVLQKKEAQCVLEWPWGFCLCHCPRQLLINSQWNGFTRLQKSFHFLSFYQPRWKAGLYLISVQNQLELDW